MTAEHESRDPGGWDDPDELDEDEFADEHEERELQGEDPTSPARGFEDLEELEDHDDY
jgi:hypothetical protein